MKQLNEKVAIVTGAGQGIGKGIALCLAKRGVKIVATGRRLEPIEQTIEGQVRGIRRMVENDAYCPDILVQVSAVNAALNSFNKVLLANHIRTCVADDIREGKDATVDELVATLQKLMK